MTRRLFVALASLFGIAMPSAAAEPGSYWQCPRCSGWQRLDNAGTFVCSRGHKTTGPVPVDWRGW